MFDTSKTLGDIKDTYQETARTMVWVWNDILSPYGRKQTIRTTLALMLAMLIGMSVTYMAKEVINAISADNRTTALWYTIAGIGGTLIASKLVMSYHDFTRELGWNDNYHNVMTSLTRLFFARTAGEMVAEHNEVGAEQVDSAKDRIQNIMYMVLFEGPSVIIGLLTSSILMFTVDTFAGCALIVIIVLNVLWFLILNSLINDKMERVDKGFRRANRRMIEKWNNALSSKVNGVEHKTTRAISRETLAPLKVDRRIWAYWFIPLDMIRGIANAIFMILILLYGLLIAQWSGGDFAAVFFWLSLVIDRFGFLGHLMRHFTSQVVRVKAVREALSTEPRFRHDVGIDYQPKKQETA